MLRKARRGGGQASGCASRSSGSTRRSGAGLGAGPGATRRPTGRRYPARERAAVPPLAGLPRTRMAGRQAPGVGGSSGASYGSTAGSTWLKWHSPTTGRGRSAPGSRGPRRVAGACGPSTRWHGPMSWLPQTPTALARLGPGQRVRPATRPGLHPEGSGQPGRGIRILWRAWRRAAREVLSQPPPRTEGGGFRAGLMGPRPGASPGRPPPRSCSSRGAASPPAAEGVEHLQHAVAALLGQREQRQGRRAEHNARRPPGSGLRPAHGGVPDLGEQVQRQERHAQAWAPERERSS
jgi:hypothetical protein